MFQLDRRKKITVRIIKHLNSLSREAAQSLFLKVFKTYLENAPSTLVSNQFEPAFNRRLN